MARIALFLFALFASLFAALASPVSVQGGQLLEKRISHTGSGTWFYPGHGNCGGWDNNDSPIVAMSKAFYDQNGGSNCGQWMYITANGKSTYAKMVDSCVGCGYYDIDMSLAVFQKFAPLGTGRIDVTWNFLAPGASPP